MSNTDVIESDAGEMPQDDSFSPQSEGGESPLAEPGTNESPDFSDPETLANAFDQLDPEALANLLAENEDSGVVENPTNEPESAEPRGENPTTKQDPEQEAKEPEQDNTPDRVRLKGLPAKEKHRLATAIGAVKDGTYESFDEAYSDLFGSPKAQAKGEGDDTETKAEAPAIPEPVAKVDQEIERLKAQRKEAREEFDNDRADEITDEINAKLLERREALRDVEKSEQSAREYTKEYTETAENLRQTYPDLNDFESPLAKRVTELRELKEYHAEKGDKGAQQFLQNPRFIADLVTQAAKDIGVSGGKNSVPPPPFSPTQRQGAVSPATATAGSLSTEAAVSLLDNLPYDDLMKVGDMIEG